MGAILRYCVKLIFGNSSFPYATLAVNFTGCFLMGFFSGLCKGYAKPFILVGFLGAFTTLSSMALETLDICSKGSYAVGVFNVIINNVFAILLVFLGLKLGSLFIK